MAWFATLATLRLGQVVLALRSGTGPLCQASMAEAGKSSDDGKDRPSMNFSPRRIGLNKWPGFGLIWIDGLHMKAGGNCPQSSWHCSLGGPGTTKGE